MAGKARMAVAGVPVAALPVAVLDAAGWPGCPLCSGGGDTYVLAGALLTKGGLPLLTKAGEALAMKNG